MNGTTYHAKDFIYTNHTLQWTEMGGAKLSCGNIILLVAYVVGLIVLCGGALVLVKKAEKRD